MDFNLPKFLIKDLENQYGEKIKDIIIDGYKTDRKVTFRVNTLKSTVLEIEKILNELKIEYEKVIWSDEAFIIKEEKENKIEELDIYKEGKIYMQSLSSMLPPIILNPQENTDILDMTAAPGGKTTQIAALTNNKSHITACEMNSIRCEKLKYNIEKQGASCVYVMQKDSRKIDDFFSFDQILLDAPCSGSGTLNFEDKNIEKYFTNKLIEKSVLSQVTLLKKAIRILKPGNTMIYSTCSILEKENEEVIKKVLEKNKIEIVPIEFKGKESIPCLPIKIEGTMCVCPNDIYEGFFVAKIRKIK